MTILVRFFGLLELAALAAFVYGFFTGVSALAIAGGLVCLSVDLMGILTGKLKPLFPIIVVLILSGLIKPWYLWSLLVLRRE